MTERRKAILRDGLDLAATTGLEIGPLADPVVLRGDGCVLYVDHTDTDHLRETYRDNALVPLERIVDVDVVWGERVLAVALAEVLGEGVRVDYVIASHVAEHVPDLITWLGEIADVLAPHGTLRLAMPDRRFSFDALREPTRLTDTLTSWVMRARRPQVRDVLDFRLHYAPDVVPQALYDGTEQREALVRAHSFAVAVQCAGWARDTEAYLDVHCTVVHPREFARLLADLAALGLLRLACAGMIDSPVGEFEFYTVMTPCEDAAVAELSWRAAAARMADPLPGSIEDRERADTGIAELQQLNVQLAQELDEARTRVVGLEQSRSWRLTAPFRKLCRR